MDCIIPYRPCSVNPGVELNYTIKSLQKHVKGLGQVVVVSEDIVPSVQGRKQLSIVNKIKWACQQPQISDPFLCVSDDVYLLRDIDPYTMPYYHSGKFVMKGNRYDRYILNSQKVGVEKNFDIHAPIRYEKQKFLDCMNELPWKVWDFLIQSVYCRGMEGEQIKDVKIHQRFTKEKIYRMIEGQLRFSTGPNGVTQAMREVWRELYD